MTALHSILSEGRGEGRDTNAAVVDALTGASIDYGSLDRLSDRLRDPLVHLGVKPGDRVGAYLRKSIDGVASIFGILKSGAAYVPVDPTAPASRNAYIHHNCAVSAVIVEKRLAEAYRKAFEGLGDALPPMILLDEVGGSIALEAALDELQSADPAPVAETVDPGDDALAYILYTSGSTGKPKGVMLTHRNALSYVQWCSETFEPGPADVFSSHAPFHFDLSVLDIYVPLKHGGSVVLIGESAGREPMTLSGIIQTHRITVWYSAPSILTLIAQSGRIAEHDFSSLRLVLFAGEVFPIVHLRSLKQQLVGPRYFNLYGPTETNVCTYHEIPEAVAEDRVDPYPIGVVCENLAAVVVDEHGRPVEAGLQGELCIAGPNVMVGYWGMPEESQDRFLALAGDPDPRWYRTGDLVVEEAGGVYRYDGRRDRMIKKRGYRVELGEIEVCLYQHGVVHEVAVVALPDEARGMRVEAHVGLAGGKRPSIVELKVFCSQRLPVYMVPDLFIFHDRLPRTSTDKVDYQTLQRPM